MRKQTTLKKCPLCSYTTTDPKIKHCSHCLQTIPPTAPVTLTTITQIATHPTPIYKTT